MNSESPSDKPYREISRLISGSAFIFIYRLFGAAATFLTQILLARWMGAAELGIYVLAFSWCILLSTLSTGGFRIASIRFIGEGLSASRPGYISGYVRRSRQIVIILSLAVAVLGSLCLLAFDSVFGVESLSVFIIALLAVPFFALLNLYAGHANALSRFPLSFLPINVFRPLLFLLAICGVWAAGKSLNANIAMSMNWIALGIVAAITIVLSNQALQSHIADVEPQYATRIWIKTAIPLLFVALFTGYFPELMVIIVGAWLPSNELAIFHVCFRVAMLISFGLYAVDAFTGPEIAGLLASGKQEKLQQVVNRVTRLRFWAALAAIIILGFAGREVLGIFGEEFTQGYLILMILAFAQLVQAGVGPTIRLISLSGHQNQSVLVFSVAIIVAIILIAILVPLFGVRGAAMATLLDTILWVAWMRYLVVRRLDIRPSIF
jgi:O-antigen/teichoic acid export membrane protein